MAVVQKIEEVCPLTGGRLLVFGQFGGGGYIVYLISATTGVALDSFVVSTPAVSPDQHWLAMRDWIIPQSETPVTEQYLLYDLTKDAAGNRSLPGVDPRNMYRYGRTMYPVTPNHAPFENHGVRRDQVHSFPGGAFFWAADSKSVLFTDRTDAGLAVVLVKIDGSDLTTLLHPASAESVCGMLSDASITIPRDDLLEVRATFHAEGSAPCTESLTLHQKDFKPANVEKYERVEGNQAVRKKSPGA